MSNSSGEPKEPADLPGYLPDETGAGELAEPTAGDNADQSSIPPHGPKRPYDRAGIPRHRLDNEQNNVLSPYAPKKTRPHSAHLDPVELTADREPPVAVKKTEQQ